MALTTVLLSPTDMMCLVPTCSITESGFAIRRTSKTSRKQNFTLIKIESV